MKKMIASKPLYLLLRVILGVVFIVAGVIKLSDPGAFAQAIDGYGLVSWRMANLLSYVLPVIEIITGSSLILDIRGALGMIVAQLLGFICVITYAIHLGMDVDCGCFGPSDPQAGSGGLWQTLIRDVLMLGASLMVYWQRRAAHFSPRPIFLLTSRNKDAK